MACGEWTMVYYSTRKWCLEKGLNLRNGVAEKRQHEFDGVFDEILAIDYIENNLEEEYLMMQELASIDWYK